MIKTDLKQTLPALERMTVLNGLLQHESNPNIENKQPGVWPYSIDDNARALIAELNLSPGFQDEYLIKTYFDYIIKAHRLDNWFNNYKKQNRRFVQGNSNDLQDCYGRANWALTEVLFLDSCSINEKQKAKELIFSSLKNHTKLNSPMSQALSLIAFSKYLQKEPNREIKKAAKKLSKKLSKAYKTHSNSNWQFPSSEMTYCSARIPHAFLLAGSVLNNIDLILKGKKILEFTLEQMFEYDLFNPIGINWLRKEEKRTYDIIKEGDKQPVEANVTAEVCYCATKILQDRAFLIIGNKVLDWIKGKNKENLSLLADNGAIYDAITPHGLNTNQGAEPLVTYLMALSEKRKLEGIY